LGIQDETKSGATFPSSQRRGGCAINKCRGATEAAQTGWSDRHGRVFAELTTPSAPIKVASRNLIRVAATPPLRGGECCARFGLILNAQRKKISGTSSGDLNLPLNGRSFDELAQLQPGVTVARFAGVGTMQSGYTTKISIRGARPEQNSFGEISDDVDESAIAVAGAMRLEF